MIGYSMKESDLINYLKYERVCIGSDGFADTIEGKSKEQKSHPRTFGSFPRILNRYVKLKRVLTLEEAIHKMTGLPSRILNLNDRGTIKEGKIADIVIFNANKIKDTATFENPFSYPVGIECIIVNGKIAVYKNKVNGLFGKVLKYK